MSTATLPVEFQDLPDGPGELSQADDGKVPVWSWEDRRLIMLPLPQPGEQRIIVRGGGGSGGGVSDHALLTNLDYASSGHTGFEAEGAAAAAIAAHLLAANPHPQYLLATDYAPITDHGALSGLADNDHPQYFLAGGVGGGQTAIGGTAASETLRLQSTANATKGKILFGNSAYDEVNNRLGIGMAGPTEKLYVYDGAGSCIVLIQTGSTAAGAAAGIDFYSDVVFANMKAYTAASPGGARFNFFTYGGYLLFGTAGNDPVYFYTQATPRGSVSGTGLWAIGDQSPTALLDVNPSTTSRAAFRVRSGSTPTTLYDGDGWNDGNAYAFAVNGTNAVNTDGGLAVWMQSSTEARPVGRLLWQYTDKTDATRASRGSITAYYTSTEHKPVTWGANSGGALLSFYDVTTPIARQVLATGASHTVDDVITALQALGLVKQS